MVWGFHSTNRKAFYVALLVLIQMAASRFEKSSAQHLRTSLTHTSTLFQRGALSLLIASANLPKPAVASTLSKNSYLGKRVLSNDASKIVPSISSPDIYYPDFFLGSWNCESLFSSFATPLGESILGASTVNQTLSELQTILKYKAKFSKSHQSQSKVISDRLYNVEQIAIASMGENCVLGDTQPGDNLSLADNLHLVLKPPNAPLGTLFEVNLKTTGRDFDEFGSSSFEAIETTEQIIDIQSEFQSQKLCKEIETITVYSKVDENKIIGVQ